MRFALPLLLAVHLALSIGYNLATPVGAAPDEGAHAEYVRIVTSEGRYLLRATLTEIESRWEPFGFVRVHRGYLANLNRAVELRPLLGGTAELVLAGDETVPVARRHVAELRRRLAV